MSQMQTGKDEDDETDLILNFALDHVNCIAGLDLQRYSFALPGYQSYET